MKKVSVVILNWNGAPMMRRFLPSVVEHSVSDEVEVCVADNGSTDDSLALLEQEFPMVRRIVLAQNYGFADGYNKALEQVEAEYVVLLNSDVEVTSGWLQPMVDYLDGHPDTVAAQPKLLSYQHREEFEYAGGAGGFMDRYGYPFCRGRIFETVERDEHQYDTITPLFWATGAALFIRQKSYREAGGLDGRFFAHMEEIDLCWRLRSRGGLIVCVPQSVVFHVGGATLNKSNPRKTFLNFRNNLLMLYKNLPEEELNTVMRVRAVLDGVAAIFFCLKGEWGDAKAVWEARREFQRMKPEYLDERRSNLRQAVTTTLPERMGQSVLWLYHVRGKKTFSSLMK